MRADRVVHYLGRLVSAIGVAFITLATVLILYVCGLMLIGVLAHDLVDDTTLKHGEAIEQTE